MKKILWSLSVTCLLGMGSFGEEGMTFDALVEGKLDSVEKIALIDEPLLQKAVIQFAASVVKIQKPKGDATQQNIDNIDELFILGRDVMAYLEMNQYRNPMSFKQYLVLIRPLFAEAKVKTRWIDDLPKNEGNLHLLMARKRLLEMEVAVKRGYIPPARPSAENIASKPASL